MEGPALELVKGVKELKMVSLTVTQQLTYHLNEGLNILSGFLGRRDGLPSRQL